MFDNIGTKIKTLASVVFGIGAVLSVLLGLIIMFSVGDLGGFFGGVIVGGIGCLISWIGCFVLYGFGELVDNTSEIKNAIVKNESKNKTEKSNRKTAEQSPVDDSNKSSVEDNALEVLNELKESGIIEEIDYQERVEALKNNE